MTLAELLRGEGYATACIGKWHLGFRGPFLPENQGFDAFIPLIDSGISFYVWSGKQFFAVLLFTCKEFDNDKAIAFTSDFLGVQEVATLAF